MPWYTPEILCACNCVLPCCYPCGSELDGSSPEGANKCVRQVTITISGIPDLINHRTFGISVNYFAEMSGFAAINGTYVFNLDDSVVGCAEIQIYEFPIDGEEWETVAPGYVPTTISTGGYIGRLFVGLSGWGFSILASSGYSATTDPAKNIGFEEDFINPCAAPSEITQLYSYIGTAIIYQKTENSAVFV